MEYIIFGAGVTGRKALQFFDYWRVVCFAANSSCESVEGKEVVSYDTMLKMMADGDYITVVASEKYYEEMVAQLNADGVKKYFVFHESDVYKILEAYPSYRMYQQTITVPYVRALALQGISKYKRIAIYGDNYFLPYLISEIAFQNDFKNIIGVIPTMGANNVRSLGIADVELDDVLGTIDCLVVNEQRYNIQELEKIERDDRAFSLVYTYYIDQYVEEIYHPELKRFKDIHKGERCFIVGNGPSMKIDDLNTLHKHKEICFGFNKIYRIFNQTKWRPEYFCMTDSRVMTECRNELIGNDYGLKRDNCFWMDGLYGFFPFGNYVHMITEPFAPNLPRRSPDIAKGVFWGGTVVYEFGINIAIYMGFKEIYMIGVDCSWSGKVTDECNHFIKNNFYECEKSKWEGIKPSTTEALLSYEEAERYSSKRGFRIYNATRGGKVEVFERVNFDELFWK